MALDARLVTVPFSSSLWFVLIYAYFADVLAVIWTDLIIILNWFNSQKKGQLDETHVDLPDCFITLCSYLICIGVDEMIIW